jgi:hypothetical protein
VLQNDDSNDDIWKPLKIPKCISQSVQRCNGTKHKTIETQKKEPGFLLHTISQINFFTIYLLKKFIHLAGKEIISSLPALQMSLLNSRLCPVTLIASTKTKSG